MENPRHTIATCKSDPWSPLADGVDGIPKKAISQGRDESDGGATSDQGHTDSTLQSYPAESPRSRRPVPSYPTLYGPSNFDREKVNEMRRILSADQQMHGTGEELADPSIITEEFEVTSNNRTIINRVKVQRRWLAKKIFKSSDREQLEREKYLREVTILKILNEKPHWHVILLERHYTDLSGRACLILSPLAQMTLGEFLSCRPNQETKALARLWIGCLICALAHIHAQKVKHKDIKPANILINGTNPVIADMGFSHRFNDNSESVGFSAGSVLYVAPEVWNQETRGRRQDVWSMLCCFIEILAFLKDIDRSTFHGLIKVRMYMYSYDPVVDWLNSLKPGAVDEEECAFIQLLLDSFKMDPEERPYAGNLATQIRAICKKGPNKYIGECCVLKDTVNTSLTIKDAVVPTSSALPKPMDLEEGSLLHFTASMALSLSKSNLPGGCSSLNALYEQISAGEISSIRSAERKFLLIIAPKHCKDGETYFSLCDGFIDSLSNAIEFGTYKSCLYNTSLGEHNYPYTTGYFEILVGEISSRYLTYHWD